MRRWVLEKERVSFTVNERRKWSVMRSSSAVNSKGVTPELQIKSRMCPLACVGIVVCCWHLKLCKQDVKSLVRGRLILSMWILKSPSSIMFGEREDRWVRKAAKSFKKSLFSGQWWLEWDQTTRRQWIQTSWRWAQTQVRLSTSCGKLSRTSAGCRTHCLLSSVIVWTAPTQLIDNELSLRLPQTSNLSDFCV